MELSMVDFILFNIYKNNERYVKKLIKYIFHSNKNDYDAMTMMISTRKNGSITHIHNYYLDGHESGRISWIRDFCENFYELSSKV